MEPKHLKIYLLPAPDDTALDSPEYQAELEAFDKTLRSHGIVPQRVLKELKAAAGGTEVAIWLSEFVIVMKSVTPIAKAIIQAISDYLRERNNRKFRVKVDDIEAEANTLKAVEKLLARAQEIQQRNEPKVIHEK
jgi:hypothetical protein